VESNRIVHEGYAFASGIGGRVDSVPEDGRSNHLCWQQDKNLHQLLVNDRSQPPNYRSGQAIGRTDSAREFSTGGLRDRAIASQAPAFHMFSFVSASGRKEKRPGRCGFCLIEKQTFSIVSYKRGHGGLETARSPEAMKPQKSTKLDNTEKNVQTQEKQDEPILQVRSNLRAGNDRGGFC
jgi:hypothetical protein